jgi:hypothetical protein
MWDRRPRLSITSAATAALTQPRAAVPHLKPLAKKAWRRRAVRAGGGMEGLSRDTGWGR